MPSSSSNEPDENLINEIVERVHGRIKPRNVWQHADSVECNITKEQADEMKVMLAVVKWGAGILAGSIVAIIGLIVILAMDHAELQNQKSNNEAMKQDIAAVRSNSQDIANKSNQAVQAVAALRNDVKNWDRRYPLHKPNAEDTTD